jgi:hypothetical protein
MPVEVRYQGEGKARHIDEIVAQYCSFQIEQLDDTNWYLGVEDCNGDYYQFWFGTKSGRGKVEVTHQGVTPATERSDG